MIAMRPFRTHGLSILAMLLLLLGTAAPAVARMTCVVDGHTMLNLGRVPAGCPTEDHGQGASVAATCCEVLQSEPQRTDFVKGGNPVLPLLMAMDLPLAVQPVLVPVHTTTTGAFSSRPPPLPSGRRLAGIGSFRI